MLITRKKAPNFVYNEQIYNRKLYKDGQLSNSFRWNTFNICTVASPQGTINKVPQMKVSYTILYSPNRPLSFLQ